MKSVVLFLLSIGVANGQVFSTLDGSFNSRSDWNPKRIPGLVCWVESSRYVLTSTGPDVTVTNGQTITRWKDLSGQGNDLNQATSGKRPSLAFVSGIPCVRFNVAHSMASSSFSGGAVSQPLTLIVAAAITNVSGGTFVTDGIGSGNRIALMAANGESSPALYAGASIVHNTDYTLNKTPHIYSCIFNQAVQSRIWQDGYATDSTAGIVSNPGSHTMTGLTVGSAYNSTFFANADVYGVLVYSGVLTRAQRRLCEGYFSRKFAITSQSIPYRILTFDGDSITAGFGVSAGQDYPSQTVALANWSYEKHNFAVSGTVWTQSHTNLADPFAWGGNKSVYVVNFGSNDIFGNHNDFATVSTNAWKICTERRTLGYKVLILDVLPRSSGTDEATRTNYNGWLAGAYTQFADGHVTLSTNTHVGVPNANLNTNYFQADAIHPNSAGAAEIAAQVLPELEKL